MKTILAATDFSAPARRAVERAAQLALAHRATLHLLYVPHHGQWSQGTGVFSRYFGDGNLPSLDEDRARLERLGAQLGPARRLSVECHVVPGNAAREIAAFARAREVDLVVLAARGASGLRLRTVGGTALKVLWNSLAPVLLVRAPVEGDYQNLVVGTDLGERALEVARYAHELAPKAALALVHAFRGEFETALSMVGAPLDALNLYRDELQRSEAARLEAHWKAVRGRARWSAERVLVHGHPLSVLNEQAAQRQADLLVVGKHSGPHWEELMLGSVVQNLAQQVRSDLLVVP